MKTLNLAWVQLTVRADDNPFSGVLPDFTVFGVQFTQLWQKLLGGAWAIALIVEAIFFLIALANMATASREQNPEAHKRARAGAMHSLIALAGTAAAAVIFGAILFLFQG